MSPISWGSRIDWNAERDEVEDDIRSLPCPEKDPLDTEGVIRNDEIEFYCDEFSLIEPLKPSHLEPASYDLSVGDYYSIGGEDIQAIDDEKNMSITIDPFEVAIIQTEEFVNLPRFLIGRWNILVSLAYDGLLWVGGPQVDPGYAGYLYCPIYNMSDTPVTLRKGDKLASLDFTKTTEYSADKYNDENYSLDYFERPPSRLVIEDYDPDELRSGLIEGAVNRIDTIEKRFVQASTLFVTTFIILFTALSIVATSGPTTPIGGEFELSAFWMLWIGAFSLIAVVLSAVIFFYHVVDNWR